MNDDTKALLDVLFGWNPPVLLQQEEYQSPRGPFTPRPVASFYDKHLAEEFVLKSVQHMPSLGDILMERVDEHLHNAPTLPTSTFYLDTEHDFKRHMTKLSHAVSNEQGVAEFYRTATFYFCCNVASTLALSPAAKEWWTLLWLVQLERRRPIAEVTVRFQPLDVAQSDKWESTEPAVRDAIAFIKDSTDWCVATVEHLSLTDGTKQLFEQLLDHTREHAIPEIEPVEFGWTFCDMNEKGRKCCSCEIMVERVCDDDPNRFWNKFVNPQNDAENTSQINPQGSGGCTVKAPTMDADPPFTEPSEISLEHLLRHSWVRAVKHNATFILISAGNYEVIAVRDREKQTLYVSDLIDPSKYSGYMKLQVGFYIAAIKDIFARLEFERGKRGDGGCDGVSI